MNEMEKLEEASFYFYLDKIQNKPRKDCIGKKCKRYKEVNLSVRCSDYGAGWCSSYDENEGTPHDKKMVKFSDVLSEFVALEKACVIVPRKKLEERIRDLEHNFLPHDVCCVPCLEKGQIIELQKLLGVEKTK